MGNMEFFLEFFFYKTLNIFYNLTIKYYRPLFWYVEHTKEVIVSPPIAIHHTQY